MRFALVAAAGLVLNTLSMWVGVELIGAHYLLSQFVTTGLVLIWSFPGNRCWTFHSAAGTE
jgi:putative flippase GtrA